MKNLIKILVSIFFLLILQFSYANDGSYYTSGNHLIPMYETTISCKKEILSIKRVDRDYVNITVYYEFFNPGEAKDVEVGFEAYSPMGDVDGTPVKGKHPYIQDFTVNLNSEIIPFKVAIVSDSIYYKNGKFIEKSLLETINNLEEVNYVDFYYVYHFNAHFKKGVNLITHTYKINLSGSVSYLYDISYILTGAKRWANKQIDNFTLLVDMGNFNEFSIAKTFFLDDSQWKIVGIGKMENVKAGINQLGEEYKATTRFVIKNGFIVFEKINFKPNGELNLFRTNYFLGIESFNYVKGYLPIEIEMTTPIKQAKDETSLKILRNLPYARRGYIFKSPEIQKYYEDMDWYIPDQNYEADLSKITIEEQEWLKKLTLE